MNSAIQLMGGGYSHTNHLGGLLHPSISGRPGNVLVATNLLPLENFHSSIYTAALRHNFNYRKLGCVRINFSSSRDLWQLRHHVEELLRNRFLVSTATIVLLVFGRCGGIHGAFRNN